MAKASPAPWQARGQWLWWRMPSSAAYFRVALASILVSAAAPGAIAQTPKPLATPPQSAQKEAPALGVTRLGGAEGWEAYSDNEKNGKVCYLIGEPSKSEPAGAKRGKIFASITHRPGERIANEVGFNAGYLFKEGSDAELLVDGRKFSLFTKKDTAWGRDAATDRAVVEALAKGKQATIKGVSGRGTETTDIYSLAGFSQALQQIDKACGVKR
jgi:invasion protein IalB